MPQCFTMATYTSCKLNIALDAAKEPLTHNIFLVEGCKERKLFVIYGNLIPMPSYGHKSRLILQFAEVIPDTLTRTTQFFYLVDMMRLIKS